MKRTRAAVVVISSLLISAGLGTAGYAGVQIYQMNSSLGTQYLPKLESSEPTQLPVEIVQPTVGDVIGSLWIPRLKRTLDIIEGTGAKELKIGVGHYVGSVLPGISDNSVLAGHRDSVFRNLGTLKLGDLMTIQTDYGRFVYEVHKNRIVKADDKTVIVPTSDSLLTLSTCYPFRFIGNAPKRNIVQAGLVIGEPVG
jgi:sortase A